MIIEYLNHIFNIYFNKYILHEKMNALYKSIHKKIISNTL